MSLPIISERREEIRTPITRLIADKHDDDVAASLRPHVIDPFARLLKGIHVGDVVNHHRHRRVANVTKRDETRGWS